MGLELFIIFRRHLLSSGDVSLEPFKAVLKGLNASAVGLIAAGCVTLYPKSVMTYADTMVFIVAGGLGAIYSFQAPFVIFWGCIFGALFSSSVLDVGQKHLYETI